MLRSIPTHLYNKFPIGIDGPDLDETGDLIYHVTRVCPACQLRMKLDIKIKPDLPEKCVFYLEILDELVSRFIENHWCC